MGRGRDDATNSEEIAAVERVIRLWLADPDVTVFCGAWNNGAIMELLPDGNASLTGPLYSGRFSGLRDLVLEDGAHHVHLDLGRMNRVRYVVLPSVCYGFRPSFELRIAAAGADPVHEFGLGIAVRDPYDKSGLRKPVALRYFSRVVEHLRECPEIVSFQCERGAGRRAHRREWLAIRELLDADGALRALSALLPQAEPS